MPLPRPASLACGLLLAVVGAFGTASPSGRLVWPALAQDKPALAVPPPSPPPRPEELTPAPAVEMPRPPERPPELAAPPSTAPLPETQASPLPPSRPAELENPAALALTVTPRDDTACRRRLERLGATFEMQAPISNGQCGAAKPLKVTALADGLTLNPPAILVCEAGEALARWATEAQVAAGRDLGQPLTSLSVGTSYECRGQNHDPDAKLSEHSFANGIDIMGFGFAKRPALPVTGVAEGTPEATFLAAVRTGACGFFRTVLGPGSDAAHANHLHLDERERNAGHRLCQ